MSMAFGFSSAAALLDTTNRGQDDEHEESRASIAPSKKGSNKRKHYQQQAEPTDVEESGLLIEPRDFEIVVTMVGWKHYKHLHDADNIPSRGTIVALQREPDNEYDANAIAVLCADNRNKIGHVSKDQAAMLASLLDTRNIEISSAAIRKIHETSFQILVQGVSNGSVAAESVVNRFETKSILDLQAVSPKISQSDVERSLCAPYQLQDLNVLPWNPLAHWKEATETPVLPWEPFDTSRFHNPRLSVEEIQATKTSSWPPSDDVFLRLGMAPGNNVEWWYRVAGLKPPCEWSVTGALDCLPHVQMSSRSQAQMASTVLEGAMHGVSDVWHPDTLEAMAKLMQQPMFWCRRSGDALIRAMGGPYVLGQQEDKLKLVCGSPHSELTQRMCVAHNLVYAAVHLTSPAAPGFNTLIFGCNLRGAGFHYHQDSVPSLKAKNAPLIPRQPVVTTVFYEQPQVDSGKEVVLWKPILNFSPVQSKSSGTGEYLGARVLSTLHGMIHVQRAGLQSSAVHGIFHAPHAEERKGFRVAITARITKPNAQDTLTDYMSVYQKVLGPEGDVQLRPKKS